VKGGFGAALIAAAFNHELYGANGCNTVMSEATAQGWKAWDLDPLFEEVPQAKYDAMWSNATSINPVFDVKVLGEMTLSAEPAAWGPPGNWWGSTCGDRFLSNLLRVFEPKLKEPATGFKGSYAGVHVRHGDKVLESKVFPLKDFMHKLVEQWPDTKNVFVATDDADILKTNGTQEYTKAGYEFNWTVAHRYSGGEPTIVPKEWNVYSHDDNTGAVSAVLNDMLGLAQASFLVGNFESNFFRIGWLLNLASRAHTSDEATANQSWCFDLYTGLDCSDGTDFLLKWCDKHNKGKGWECTPAVFSQCPRTTIIVRK